MIAEVMEAACRKCLVIAKWAGEGEEGKGSSLFTTWRSYDTADVLCVWLPGPLGDGAQHGHHQSVMLLLLCLGKRVHWVLLCFVVHWCGSPHPSWGAVVNISIPTLIPTQIGAQWETCCPKHKGAPCCSVNQQYSVICCTKYLGRKLQWGSLCRPLCVTNICCERCVTWPKSPGMIFAYLSEAEIRVRCLSDPFVEHTDITTLPSLPGLIIGHKKFLSNTDSIIYYYIYYILLLLYTSFLLFTLGLWTVAVTEVVRKVAVYSCQLRETILITFFFLLHIQVTLLAMLRLTSQNLEITSAEPSGEPHPFSLEVLLCFPPH